MPHSLRSLIDAHQRPEGDCLIWTGAVTSHGYGRVPLLGSILHAHRVAWELVHGPIPDDLELDHLCRVKLCVRVDHLEAVTHAENVRRGATALWAERGNRCKHGHEMTPENTRWEPTRTDQKTPRCIECARQRAREAMRKQRARQG